MKPVQLGLVRGVRPALAPGVAARSRHTNKNYHGSNFIVMSFLPSVAGSAMFRLTCLPVVGNAEVMNTDEDQKREPPAPTVARRSAAPPPDDDHPAEPSAAEVQETTPRRRCSMLERLDGFPLGTTRPGVGGPNRVMSHPTA